MPESDSSNFNATFARWSAPALINPSPDSTFCDGWLVNYSGMKGKKSRFDFSLEPLDEKSSTGLKLLMRTPPEVIRILGALPSHIGGAPRWRLRVKMRGIPTDAGNLRLDNIGLFKQEGKSRKWIRSISGGLHLDGRWQHVTAKVSEPMSGPSSRYLVSLKFEGQGTIEVESAHIEVGLVHRIRTFTEGLVRKNRLSSAERAVTEEAEQPAITPAFAHEIMQRAFLGTDAITGDFEGLRSISYVTRATPLLIRFLALDRRGTMHSYLTRADQPQLLALEETRGPIEYIAAGGQSLAVGGGMQGSAVITEPPSPHRCLRLSTGAASDPGTIGVEGRPFVVASVKGFAPAVEGTQEPQGESQGTSLMRWLDEAILDEGREGRTFLYRSHGQGGAAIAELGAGTQPYRNALLEIERAFRIARNVYMKRLVVRAVTWSHGEADRSEIPQRVYTEALRSLRTSYERDIREKTGQSEPVYLLVDQLAASSTGRGPGDTALAQLQAVEEDPFILMSCPKYFLQDEYGYSDPVHLKPLGYDVLGEYHAKVWHDVFVKGQTWKGLRPKTISIVAPNRFDVEFWVPVEPLVLDTQTLPNFNGEFGFVYEDRQGACLKSGGVRLLNATTLRFTTDADIREHSGRTLSYAHDDEAVPAVDRSAIWGNLRDNESRRSIAMPRLSLSNWCVSFVSHF